MQKHFLLIAVICAASLILLFSCQKENHNSIDNDFILEAKTWFTTTVLSEESKLLRKPFSELSKTSPQRLLARMNRLSKKLDWANSKIYLVNDLEYVVVPLLKDNLKLKNNFFLERLFLFSKKNKNEIQLDVVELLTKNQKVENSIEVVSTAFANKMSGKKLPVQTQQNISIFFYDKSYNPLSSYEFNSNMYKPLLASCINKPNSPNAQSTNETEGGGDCVLWGVFQITYDGNGNILEQELLYTYWVGDCNNEEEVPEPSGGGEETYQITSTDFSSTDEENDPNEATVAPRIQYSYIVTVSKIVQTGEVVGVIVYPATASPMIANYIDGFGRNTTRTLTLLAQTNT